MNAAVQPSTPRAYWETGLASYQLVFPRISADEYRAVNSTRFPPIAGIYLEQIGDIESLPPTADAFETAVLLRTNMARTNAVCWRLRANFYPSFVAQQHLTLILLERFRHVTWSAREDLTGIDIHLAYRGLALAIRSVKDSPNSRGWQVVKQRRNPDSPDVWYVDLYRRNNEYTVGPFWLHHPERVEEEIKAAVGRITPTK